MSASRERDEYDRAFFGPNEVPPADEAFAHWRGRLTHPEAVTTPSADRHDRLCVGGWIPSGKWWLHCGRCRPSAKGVEQHG